MMAYECDLVYECKVCRNLFRSLANFISHKRVYCKEQYSDTKHVLPENRMVIILFVGWIMMLNILIMSLLWQVLKIYLLIVIFIQMFSQDANHQFIIEVANPFVDKNSQKRLCCYPQGNLILWSIIQDQSWINFLVPITYKTLYKMMKKQDVCNYLQLICCTETTEISPSTSPLNCCTSPSTIYLSLVL